MIHIDELFRQRMEDREASPRPGAWSNMRELLEKEMPVAQASTNWRRVFGYFTGMLLLASASVGGYSLYTGQLQSDAGTAPLAVRASNTAIAGGAGSGAASADKASPTPGASTAAQGNSAQHTAASGLASTQRAVTTSNNRTTTTANQTAAPSNAGQSGSVQVNTSHARPVSADEAVAATAGRNTPRLASTTPAAQDPASASAAPAFTASANAERGARPAAEKLIPQGATGSQMPASRPAAALPEELSQFQSGMASSRPAQGLRVLDTIQRIEIVTRRSFAPGSRRPVYRLDTLPTEYVVVERIMPVPVAEPAAEPAPALALTKPRSARKSPLTTAPAASAPVSRRPEQHAAPINIPESTLDAASREATATANEVAGRFSGSKLNFWQSLRLDERLASAKQGLQSIELYPGVIAGINATVLTPNALGGFQFGLSSLLAINDWWSVLGEVKYMHRFNTGSSVRDDYMSVKDVSETAITLNGKPHTNYEWKEAKVQHYFNYETVQTLEIPVMLRYNNNRFFTQGGVNFVSSRPIGAREVTVQPTEYAAGPGGAVPVDLDYSPVPKNTAATIKMADFGNRFGIGYALGAGYSFTPAVYMDVRLTQTFWDNAKTEGARQISRDLLRNPSFQLSLGYRFGTTKQRD